MPRFRNCPAMRCGRRRDLSTSSRKQTRRRRRSSKPGSPATSLDASLLARRRPQPIRRASAPWVTPSSPSLSIRWMAPAISPLASRFSA